MTILAGGRSPRRVVIAGGGVAGVEAMLALRALAAQHVRIELLAPEAEFVYRPLAVAVPFGLADLPRLEIEAVARRCGAKRHAEALAAVEPEERVAVTSGGRRIGYDALLVAIGTEARPALDGAITFAGAAGQAGLARVLADLEAQAVRRVTFVVPAATAWSLPVYELALLTAERIRRRRIAGAELVVVTHEPRPLSIFGDRASARVAGLLGEAGVALRTDRVARRVEGGRLELVGGEAIAADAVVSMPRLAVRPIPGLPQDADGFIPVDAHGRVAGLEDVYAAGDASSFPIKQGGIAAQQADAAAEAIAAAAGAPVKPQSAPLVMRGALLTGSAPEFLYAEPTERSSRVSQGSLWWPPGKVAGRYLTPFVAQREETPGGEELIDLTEYAAGDPAAAEAGQVEALKLALAAADAEAGWGDHATALKWLEVAEQLNVVLPEEYAERRRAWQTEAESHEGRPPTV